MRRRGLVRLALGGLGVAMAIGGCSGSSLTGTSGGGPPAADISGTYSLVSLTQGGVPAPAGSTGTITLTQTTTNHGTYSVNLTINSVPQVPIVDQGTYVQKVTSQGDSIYQTSSGSFGQQVGTYTFKDNVGVGMDTLTVSVVAQSIPILSVWFK
jgi:hypothetical protein